MAKYPKMPSGSRNPFERGLEGGMRVRGLKAEKIIPQDTVGGCGDPRCPMCYPNGKPEYTEAGRGARPDMAFNKAAWNAREEAYRRMQDALDYSPGAIAYMEPPRNTALSEAREPVEEWLIKIDPSTSWSDVVGNDSAREALIEAIETPLKEAELYAHYGLRPPKGVLLWGPPGNGKTMFARAAGAAIARHFSAGEAEILLINGSALQSPWVGETEERIRACFAYAREYKQAFGHPLLIFIDEADALLPPRSESPMFSVRNVSTFLAEMDGIEESSAFVVLATNRPEEIDEALLRDGRCDRKIKIERPTFDAAREIIQNALHKVPTHFEDVERLGGIGWLAKAALDYFVLPEHRITNVYRVHPDGSREEFHLTLSHLISGAMMVGLVNRAKSIAFRRDRLAGTITGVSEADLIEAVKETLKENIGLRHEFAARELIEDLDRREQKKTRYNNSLN